ERRPAGSGELPGPLEHQVAVLVGGDPLDELEALVGHQPPALAPDLGVLAVEDVAQLAHWISPLKWTISGFRASRTAKAWSSLLRNAAFAGSRIGFAKRTSTEKFLGSLPSSAARQRAFVHIPCAIARGKPKSLAPRSCMWIGLRSPETSA